MLKQSLEGAKVQVPYGVWESIGSSIGTNAAVSAKISALKILSLKYITAAIVSGAMIWGVYEFISNNNEINIFVKNTNEVSINENQKPKTENNLKNEEENLEVKTDLNNKTEIIPYPPVINDSSIIQNAEKQVLPKTDTSKKHITEKSKANLKNDFKDNKDDVIPDSEIVKNNEEKTNDNDNNTSIENKYSSENILIPNAFTPYEIDGFNDCFKILIENETKFVLQIFDENRVIVFETTDKNNCWNGINKNNGEMCKRGAYSFKLIYELNSGYRKTERGLINLF